jgi:hypothetical protein
MMERDVQAVLTGLARLADDTESAAPVDAMRNYATAKALCSDLREAAAEYDGHRNIMMVIGEVENHMAALAGIFPTWDLPREQHHAGAHAAIHKLAMPTCFGIP